MEYALVAKFDAFRLPAAVLSPATGLGSSLAPGACAKLLLGLELFKLD